MISNPDLELVHEVTLDSDGAQGFLVIDGTVHGIIMQSFLPTVFNLIERASGLQHSISDVALRDLEQTPGYLRTRASTTAFSIGSRVLPLLPRSPRRKILLSYSQQRFFEG